MKTAPRLQSFDDWKAAYPLSFEDYCDNLGYQREFISILCLAIRRSQDERKTRYLNSLLAQEQATHYALVGWYRAA
jgi:hypothetical protein